MVSDDVRRYGFPRSDLSVTLDGVTIKPAWVPFATAIPTSNQRLQRRSCLPGSSNGPSTSRFNLSL